MQLFGGQVTAQLETVTKYQTQEFREPKKVFFVLPEWGACLSVNSVPQRGLMLLLSLSGLYVQVQRDVS